jgi:hypothetical protein
VIFPGTVPRRRAAFARVKIVFVDGVDGVRGVAVHCFVGVKRETVRLPDCGVGGRPVVNRNGNGLPVVLETVDFFGVVGGMFSLFPVTRLGVLGERDTGSSISVPYAFRFDIVLEQTLEQGTRTGEVVEVVEVGDCCEVTRTVGDCVDDQRRALVGRRVKTGFG